MRKITILAVSIILATCILVLLTCKPSPQSQKFTNCQIQIFEKPLSDMDSSKSYHEQSVYFVILLAEKVEIDLGKQVLIAENCEYTIPDSRDFHDQSWSFGDMFIHGDLNIHLKKRTQSPGTILIDADKAYVYSYNKKTKKFEFSYSFKRKKGN